MVNPHETVTSTGLDNSHDAASQFTVTSAAGRQADQPAQAPPPTCGRPQPPWDVFPNSRGNKASAFGPGNQKRSCDQDFKISFVLFICYFCVFFCFSSFIKSQIWDRTSQYELG